MLQTTFTNFRTLSFAFVMVAMLMVGTMMPVHQAAAQEVSVEQRAAMLAQISQLMELITQLMAQMQVMQSGAVQEIKIDDQSNEIKKQDVSTQTKVTYKKDVCPYTWTRTLKQGSKGADVTRLQRFLNQSSDTRVALSGSGSRGYESDYYDSATADAVSKFQVKYRSAILSPLGLVNPTGEFNPSTQAKANSLCLGDRTSVDEVDDLDPEIKLISPNGKQTFDKSKRNDDVIIRWNAEDVPANTNVIIETELVEAYAGTFITGGTSQVLAKEGVQEHRQVIDREGTLGAGEYKVRVSLQECHSRGCNVSYTLGPLKENLKTYDRSSYGYFTVIDSELADVRLRVSGYGDPNEIDLDINDTITVNHYPVGAIDECVITGRYEKGDSVTKSSWPNTIKSGQYGRTYFSAVGPDGVLEEVRVECEDKNGQLVAEDTITFNVDEGDIGSFEITLNGDVIDEGESVSEATAKAACVAAYNDYEKYNFKYQDVLRCTWNGKVFKTVDAWKG